MKVDHELIGPHDAVRPCSWPSNVACDVECQLYKDTYFTINSTMEAKFLQDIVVRTMLAFTRFGFSV